MMARYILLLAFLVFSNLPARAVQGEILFRNPRSVQLTPAIAPVQFVTDRQNELEGQYSCPVSTNPEFEEMLLDHINAEREHWGLAPLVWDDELAEAARKHSADMACNDYFSHDSLDGTTFDQRIAAEGYEFITAGETLYAGEGVFNDPLQAFYGWFNSEEHYAVMTYPDLSEVGIGYVFLEDSRYGGYFSADYGTPLTPDAPDNLEP